MANTEIIDKLVSDEALEDLKVLNKDLAASYEAMGKLLKNVQSLTTEFDKQGKSVSELKGIVDATIKVEAEKNALIKKETELLAQKERVVQEELKTEIQRKKVVQESLKTEVQTERVTREKIKTKQAEAKATEQQARADKKADDAMRSQVGSINKMRGLMAGLVVEYNRADEATRRRLAPAIRELQERINAANAAIGRHQGYVGHYQRALMGLGKHLLGTLGVVGGLTMFARVLKDGASTIVKFEQANVNLATILGKNVKEISALTASAKMLGNTTEWTASQVTQLQTELAKLGFAEGQIVSMQSSILRFATAMGADLAPAAELAGSALRAFGMRAADTSRVASVMVAGANKSALSFEYLNTAMSTIAPVAKAFGFTIEDTVALLGTLSNAGFDASSAATATRNILLNLADANGKLAKELGKPVKTIPELVSALKELRARGANLNDTLELTDKRSVAAFNTFMNGTEVLIELRGALEDVGGELERIQKERLETVEGSVKLLKSAWESLMLSFSSSTGIMKSVVDGLADIVNWISRAMTAYENSKKVHTKTTWYNDIIQENRESASMDYGKRFEEKKKSGYDIDVIYQIEAAQAGGELDKYQKEFDEFMQNRERAINAGIIKQGEWSKADSETYNKLKLNIDTYTVSLEALREVYDDFKNADLAVDASGLGLGDEKAKREAERAAEKARREEEKRVKQLAEDIKSLGLIEMFRLKRSAEINKEIADDDEKTWDERREAAKASIKAEIDAINKRRDAEIAAVDEAFKHEMISKTTAANQKDLILEKAAYETVKLEAERAGKIRDLNAKEADRAFKDIQENISRESAAMDAAMQDELVKRAKQYEEEIKQHANSEQQRKEITEKYQKERLEIIRKYNMQALNFEAEQLNVALDITDLSENEKSDIRKKADELQKKAAREMAEYEVNQTEDKIEKMLTLEQKLKKFLEDERTKAVMKTWEVTLETMNMYYDNELARIDEVEKREKESFEERLKVIDENVEAGAMSEEKAAAIKREIDEEQLTKEKELEQQRKDMQKKQSVWQKSNAMIQAAINTALAVTSAIATPPAPLGIALAAVVGAMGAAQIAMIASQTVPSYARGTKDHAGGPAIVGDGGRSEMVVLPSGGIWKTPATDTLAYLPKGAEVLPDFRTAFADMFSRPYVPCYDDNRVDTGHSPYVQSHDDVLRRNTKEMNVRLNAIDRSIRAIRANSVYNDKRAMLAYRFNKISRHGS
jgi:TP901 family phage tail tape measure protein